MIYIPREVTRREVTEKLQNKFSTLEKLITDFRYQNPYLDTIIDLWNGKDVPLPQSNLFYYIISRLDRYYHYKAAAEGNCDAFLYLLLSWKREEIQLAKEILKNNIKDYEIPLRLIEIYVNNSKVNIIPLIKIYLLRSGKFTSQFETEDLYQSINLLVKYDIYDMELLTKYYSYLTSKYRLKLVRKIRSWSRFEYHTIRLATKHLRNDNLLSFVLDIINQQNILIMIAVPQKIEDIFIS